MEPPNLYLPADVLDFAFSPAADCLALSLADGSVELHAYSPTETRRVLACAPRAQPVRLTRFSPSGRRVFCGDGAALRLLEAEGGGVAGEAPSGGQPYECCFLSEHALAVSFDDGALAVLDTRSFERVYASSLAELGGGAGDGQVFSALLPSADRHLLFAPATDGNLYTFDLRRPAAAQNKLFARTAGYDEELCAVAALDTRLVCATGEGNLQVYKWGLFGQYVDRVRALAGELGCLVAVDGETLAAGGEDGRVRLWRLGPHRVCALEPHADDGEPLPVERVDVSRCRRVLASIAHDRAVKFYDLTELDAFAAATDDDPGGNGGFRRPRDVRAEPARAAQRDFFGELADRP